MEVYCSTCGEPWEGYYLLHDSESDGSEGWEFGITRLNVTHCPCCMPSDKPDPAVIAQKAELEQLFGADLDGLECALADLFN